MEVGPARRGPQTLRLRVVPSGAAAKPPAAVEVQLSQAAGPVQDLKVQFPYRLAGVVHGQEPTPVTFTSADVDVPRTGRWIATVTVVADRLDQYTADLGYRVQ